MNRDNPTIIGYPVQFSLSGGKKRERERERERHAVLPTNSWKKEKRVEGVAHFVRQLECRMFSSPLYPNYCENRHTVIDFSRTGIENSCDIGFGFWNSSGESKICRNCCRYIVSVLQLLYNYVLQLYSVWCDWHNVGSVPFVSFSSVLRFRIQIKFRSYITDYLTLAI